MQSNSNSIKYVYRQTLRRHFNSLSPIDWITGYFNVQLLFHIFHVQKYIIFLLVFK